MCKTFYQKKNLYITGKHLTYQVQGHSKACLQDNLFEEVALQTEVIKNLLEVKVKPLNRVLK